MPKLTGNRLPAYRKHKQSGQAIVTLSGRDHLLGRHGTIDSRAKDDRLIAEWLANGTDVALASNAANQYQTNPSAGGATMLYDGRGNLTYDGAFTYTYDAADRLTSATPTDHVAHPNKMEAGYDDQGRRIWKKTYAWDSGASAWTLSAYRKFAYAGWNLVADFVQDPATGLDKLSRSYAWGQDMGGGIGGLLSITTYQSDGTTVDKTYIPLYDRGGNVVGLSDGATGNLVAAYEYDPFGNVLSATGAAAALAANPFGFSTKYRDAETGLSFYGYRYYSPRLGRWMTRDPLQESGGVNVYAFVNNDPVNKVDQLKLAESGISQIWRLISNPTFFVETTVAAAKIAPAVYAWNVKSKLEEEFYIYSEGRQLEAPVAEGVGFGEGMADTVISVAELDTRAGNGLSWLLFGDRMSDGPKDFPLRCAKEKLVNQFGSNFDQRAFEHGRWKGNLGYQ
jgi:RHS repeat-associated protein